VSFVSPPRGTTMGNSMVELSRLSNLVDCSVICQFWPRFRCSTTATLTGVVFWFLTTIS